MCKLQVEHPDVYNIFEEGYHVIRWSDRLWAGLSVDLIIEQVMMRSMKTSGGLTRGRVMKEHQRITWLLSMPACARANMSQVKHWWAEHGHDMYHKSMCHEGHTHSFDLSPWKKCLLPRSKRTKCLDWGPCTYYYECWQIARTIGNPILAWMNGQTTTRYSFKEKDHTINLNIQSSVGIGGEELQVDPQLLFQPLTVAAKASRALTSVFKYELCS